MSNANATQPLSAAALEAAEALRRGDVVVLPTETVYGVAGVLTNAGALRKLREIQELRGSSATRKPVTLHLGSRGDATRYLGEVSEVGKRLMQKVWPGPVGLIFEVCAARRGEVARALGVAEGEIYDGEEITLRCPDHGVTIEILSGAGGDVVVAQAASMHGGAAHRVDDIDPAVLDRAALVVDGGPTRLTKPSTLLRVGEKGYEVARAGVYDGRIIDRMLKTTILFVCSGNTCRSPMAAALARKVVAKKLGVEPEKLEEKGVVVASAGTFAHPGARATPEGVEALKGMGADLSKHRSQPLTVELVHGADAIFTMGRGHRSAVLAMVPGAVGKTQTLDPEGDIDDPIGSDVTVYRRLAGELEKLIERRVAEMKDI